MAPSASNKLISIQPDELKFIFELEKQSYCDLKVANQTEHYVAFKVKTTSPKKYFVRPNTGLIQPWDSCIIRVTLQALRECPPPDMQCKDKFLFQSAIVPPHTYVHELPQNTFNKDSGKRLEECKLKVSYISPPSPQTSFESGVTNNEGHITKTISRLKEERDAATKKTQQLQLELDMLKTQINERNDQGFTFKIAAFVGLIGLILGFILKLSLSPPQQQTILVNTLYDLNK